VDESRAVLDVQFAVDAIHWYERRQPTLCFFFDPATKHVSLQPSDHAWRLEVTRSRQVLGERVWWRCPVCGRRRRFLYHFVVAAAGEPRPVLGCRTCLGLTYPSRARHRCPDQDRRAAADGDEAAADRIRRREAREAHRFEVACERDVALVTAFRRRIVSMAKEMEEANPRRHPSLPIASRSVRSLVSECWAADPASAFPIQYSCLKANTLMLSSVTTDPFCSGRHSNRTASTRPA